MSKSTEQKPIKFNAKNMRIVRVANKVVDTVGKGGKVVMAKVLKEEGYSPAVVNNPSKVTETKAYKEILESAGLTPRYLARKHRKLADLGTMHEWAFHHVEKKRLPDKEINQIVDKFGGEVLKILREPVYETQWSDPAEDDAEGARPQKMRVETDFEDIRVYYKMPDGHIQKAMLELAYKVRGDIAPNGDGATYIQNNFTQNNVTVNAERRAKIDSILQENQ